MSTKPIIFISHVHEDAEIAMALRAWLLEKLAGSVDIFVSSDKREGLSGGEDWWDKIRMKLKDATVVLVVLTRRSLERRWIYFESGGAYFLARKTIPLIVGAISESDLRPPLNQLQAYNLALPEDSCQLFQQLVSEFGLKATDDGAQISARLREIDEKIGQASASKSSSEPPRPQPPDDHFPKGFAELLEDVKLSEILVNGPNDVFYMTRGRLQRAEGIEFRDGKHVMNVINMLIAPCGRLVSESSPMAVVRLADGSQLNAVVPPIAVNGPSFTLRRPATGFLTIQDLVAYDTLTGQMADFLRCCVLTRLNIVISGGTAAGKSTMLGVLASFIPKDSRIIVIEDNPELKLSHPHVLRLAGSSLDEHGQGEITSRELIRHARRMLPDRIVVGEVRGAEAADILDAMTTGLEGCLTTVHAASPQDAFSRLETMFLQSATALPLSEIRQRFFSAIDIIVQQNRMVDGARKIVSISEIQDIKDDHIQLRDIFVFRQEGITPEGKVIGHFAATGIKPKSLARFQAFGVDIDEKIFEEQAQGL